ncbi:MAG: 50S ribosomal protein L18 [bacterium]
MTNIKLKLKKKNRRRSRVMAKIFGTEQVPRLSVFRSNRHIYWQLVDDSKKKIILSAGDFKGSKLKKKMTKTASAYETGKLIAQKAKDLKIEKIVFSRGGYKYHGRIKALAEGAREGGLKF